MEIETTARCERRTPSGAVQVYPAGWAGEIDDATGGAWIAAGTARQVIVTGGTLTPAETHVLKSAAQDILAGQQAAAAAQLSADLAAMTVAELREMATAAGLPVEPRARKAALVGALLARHAEILAAEAAAPHAEA